MIGYTKFDTNLQISQTATLKLTDDLHHQVFFIEGTVFILLNHA